LLRRPCAPWHALTAPQGNASVTPPNSQDSSGPRSRPAADTLVPVDSDVDARRSAYATQSNTLKFDIERALQRQLGDYELFELIGEGGMGAVYRARQISLDRDVAVKVLSAKWAAADFTERFQREARNAGRMQHAHIVQVYEVGTAEGLHFYSMRLVRGDNLAEMLHREGRLTPARAAAMLIPIARAIDYAHHLGVLHLDLKPANILVDEDGAPHVADFGLARRLERELAVTKHEVSGTPSYMAPEQAASGPQKISAATDIWGLGAILYELAAGQPPFLAESAEATLKDVVEGKLRKPREIVANLPRDLEAIIEKCLAHDASGRYATAGELADDLDAFVARRPVAARPLNPLQRVQYWVRREPRLAVAAVLIAALLAGIAVTHQWRQTAIPAKSIAVLPFENLSDDKANAYFASGMQDEILTRLAGIHQLKVISRTSTEKYSSNPTDLKTVGEQLGVATVLEGSVQKAGNVVHINVQLIDTANGGHLWAQSYDRELKDIFAVEREVAQNVADALKAQLQPQEAALVAAVPTANPAAYDLYLRAMEHYNRAHDQDVLTTAEMPQAIALFEQALAADPRFALAAATLADAHMRIYFNAPDRTEARLAAAKAAADRALVLQPDLGEAHYALALYYYWGHRDYAAAMEQLLRARQSLPNSADVASSLAAIARRQGRWDEAIAGFQRAALFDPRSSFPLDQLGFTYESLRRYADADRAYAQSVAVAPDAADERVTHALNTAVWKGDVAPLRNALQALTPGSDAYIGNASSFYAAAWWSRDYDAAIRIAQSDHADEWADQNNIALPRELYLARAYQAAGDDGKAKEAYLKVSTTVGAALAQRPNGAELNLALALANTGLGNKDDALSHGRQAVSLLPVSRDALTGSAMLVWLAQVEVGLGEADAAFDHLRQALAQPSGVVLSPALLKLDPVWDPLRKDPRFVQLLALGEVPVAIKTAP
ncbi:MAG: protein kinase domain-containing protein, partial [Rudaea sp.]